MAEEVKENEQKQTVKAPEPPPASEDSTPMATVKMKIPDGLHSVNIDGNEIKIKSNSTHLDVPTHLEESLKHFGFKTVYGPGDPIPVAKKR